MAKKSAQKVPIDLKTYLHKTMSKELQLTISERVGAAKIFDEFKGGITQLAAIMDDLKSLTISEEEWTKASLVKTKNSDNSESWNWNDEGSEKAVNFGVEAIEYLKGKIEAKSAANELSLADKALISLNKKITS